MCQDTRLLCRHPYRINGNVACCFYPSCLQLSGALRLLLHPGFALPFQGVHVSSTSHGWFGKTLDSNVVLSPDSPQMRAWYRTPLKTPHCVEVLMRTLPIWLTVLLLLVTHVPQLKLQDMLRR